MYICICIYIIYYIYYANVYTRILALPSTWQSQQRKQQKRTKNSCFTFFFGVVLSVWLVSQDFSWSKLPAEDGMKLSLQTWKDGKEVTSPVCATETSEVVQHPWGFFVGSNWRQMVGKSQVWLTRKIIMNQCTLEIYVGPPQENWCFGSMTISGSFFQHNFYSMPLWCSFGILIVTMS